MRSNKEQRGRWRVVEATTVWVVGLLVGWAVLPAAVLAQSVPAPAGKVAWWPGEGSAADLVAGNNGELVGNTSFVAGKVGQAFSLDGDHDAVQTGNVVAFQLQDFTIEAWIARADTTVVARDTLHGEGAVVFGWGSQGYALGFFNDGRLLLTRVDVDFVDSGALRVTDKGFHHVAVTKSGSTVIFYLDGVASAPHSYNPGFTFAGGNTAIGQRGDLEGNTFWGLIDEVGLYNRALSSSEILAIFKAGSAGQTMPQALAVTALGISPSSVPGSQSTTGRVTLNGPAPSGGAVVTLTKAVALMAANVPASVTVVAGASSANFSITTASVSSTQSGTITATLGSSNANATLTVRPIAVTSVTLNPNPVAGGSPVSAFANLEIAAPAGGIAVNVSSDNTAVANPAVSSVTVLAGNTSAGFTVNTTAVSSTSTARITASSNGTSADQTLTVNPPPLTPVLTGLTLLPATVPGGLSATGTVTLSRAAPSGGTVVALSKAATLTAAWVPANVTVPAGASAANFLIPTSAVTTSQSGTITASLDGTTRGQTLTVRPLGVQLVALNPNPVEGGNAVSGEAHLEAAAPAGGITVNLSSSNASVAFPTEASVTVAAGRTSALFRVNTRSVSSPSTALITATANGIGAGQALTVNPPTQVTLFGFEFSPTTVFGGQSVTGTVRLSGPAPPGGVVVTLSKAAALTAATVPTSVRVNTGRTSETFVITTVAPTSQQSGMIAASYGGVTLSNPLTVAPPTPSWGGIRQIVAAPPTVRGGDSATVQVILHDSAPVGFVAGLGSGAPNVARPAVNTIDIPAGTRTFQFTVNTFPVTSVSPVYLGIGFPRESGAPGIWVYTLTVRP